MVVGLFWLGVSDGGFNLDGGGWWWVVVRLF